MFELHPQFLSDTIPVGRLKLSRVLLMNDSNYPWLILVPERAGVTEIYELSSEDRNLLQEEIAWLSERMAESFKADKMNVAALGNVVSQLHVHLVVRYHSDPTWPAPVWGKLPAKHYGESEKSEMVEKVKSLLER